MKANRKFLKGDEAVSPVIAVILMVAITVVLAATVYVWVSGFGSGGGNTPAHTMSLTSGGAITNDGLATPVEEYKPYTVSSADPSLTYGDLKVTVNGEEFTFVAIADCADLFTSLDAGEWGACGGTTPRAADSLALAADKIYVMGDAGALSGSDLIFLDKQANSLMVSLKIR